MAETAASVPPPVPPAKPDGLVLRALSAAVMAPLALLIVWAGTPWLTVMVAAASGAMIWEWVRLTGCVIDARDRAAVIAAGPLAVVLASLHWPELALLAAAAGGVLAACRCGGDPGGDPVRRLWLAGGAIWISAASADFIWLRDDASGGGWRAIFWLLALVWAVDIAAYAAGRTIGGPKLAPRISPKKTWAGLIGGLIGALIVGFIAAQLRNPAGTVPLMMLSGVLALIEQAGDLAESYAKRRFGVKDSGNLIPGHGGLLDRLDGLLAVILAIAVILLVTEGNIPLWR